ncbi:MAG: hypothetical protein AAGD05_09820, partial [Bacteroidota bacterium]
AAIEKLDRSQMTPEQRMHFEMTLAKQGSIIAMHREERKRYTEEATREGLARGLKEGIEQGIEQGIQKGLKQGVEQGEKAANLATAKILKSKGIDWDIIAESTGLSMTEIDAL